MSSCNPFLWNKKKSINVALRALREFPRLPKSRKLASHLSLLASTIHSPQLRESLILSLLSVTNISPLCKENQCTTEICLNWAQKTRPALWILECQRPIRKRRDRCTQLLTIQTSVTLTRSCLSNSRCSLFKLLQSSENQWLVRNCLF